MVPNRQSFNLMMFHTRLLFFYKCWMVKRSGLSMIIAMEIQTVLCK